MTAVTEAPAKPLPIRGAHTLLKLVLLVLTLPALHTAARSVFSLIRVELDGGSPEGPTGLLQTFTLLVAVAIAVLLVTLWLARYKPRLGERP